MKRIVWVVLALLSTAQAASFDCGRASSTIENLICTDSQLSKSDEDLAAAYVKAMKDSADPATVKKQQREWLASTSKRCNDVICLKAAYSARIAQLASGNDAQVITTGDVQQSEGISYRTISALNGAVTSIELLGEGGKYAVINQKLLAGLRSEIKDSFECQSNLDRMTGMSGMEKENSNFSIETRFVSLNGRWITLREGGGGNCGGAHPTNATIMYTLDTNSGEELQLSTWLKSEKKNNYFYSPPEKLNDLIIRQAIRQSKKNHPGGDQEDEECLDLLGGYDDIYKLALGKTGIVFSTFFSHSTAACDEDVEIPYAKLQPFLTKEGREEAARLVKDSASGRSQ